VYARTTTDALQTLHACVSMVDLPNDAVIQVDTRRHALTGSLDNVDLPASSYGSLLVIEHLNDDRWPRDP
jgi:hypothetical protein